MYILDKTNETGSCNYICRNLNSKKCPGMLEISPDQIIIKEVTHKCNGNWENEIKVIFICSKKNFFIISKFFNNYLKDKKKN